MAGWPNPLQNEVIVLKKILAIVFVIMMIMLAGCAKNAVLPPSALKWNACAPWPKRLTAP